MSGVGYLRLDQWEGKESQDENNIQIQEPVDEIEGPRLHTCKIKHHHNIIPPHQRAGLYNFSCRAVVLFITETDVRDEIMKW